MQITQHQDGTIEGFSKSYDDNHLMSFMTFTKLKIWKKYRLTRLENINQILSTIDTKVHTMYSPFSRVKFHEHSSIITLPKSIIASLKADDGQKRFFESIMESTISTNNYFNCDLLQR
jgi:hypothetical protein